MRSLIGRAARRAWRLQPQSQPTRRHVHTRLTPFAGVSDAVLHRELFRGWPVEIRACGDKGFGLFATRAIPAGAVVFEEAPLACVEEARAQQQHDEEYEEEEMEEEEVTDEQKQQVTQPLAPTSCAYCRAPLHPLTIVDQAAAVLASHSSSGAPTAAASAAAWSELRRDSSLLRRLGLDPRRTPLCSSGPTPCRSNQAGSPSHRPEDPPCSEWYCGPVCESGAWERFHAKEHMSAEEVARFDSSDMAELLEDEHKRTLLALLLRITAQLRSQAGQPSVDSSALQAGQQSLRQQLSVLDHLSHLSSLDSLTHAFSEADLGALDRAVAPMLQRVVQSDPALQRRLQDAGARSDKEGVWMLRRLLGALVSNSFRLAHAQPSLVLLRGAAAEGASQGHQGEEVDVVVQQPVYATTAATAADPHSAPSDSAGGSSSLTQHAALFSFAAYLNHACLPHSNLAVEMDPTVPLAFPDDAANGAGAGAGDSSTPPLRLLPPAGQWPRTRFAAVRDIPQGHELLWTYTLDASTLPARYGFRCTCPACTATTRK